MSKRPAKYTWWAVALVAVFWALGVGAAYLYLYQTGGKDGGNGHGRLVEAPEKSLNPNQEVQGLEGGRLLVKKVSLVPVKQRGAAPHTCTPGDYIAESGDYCGAREVRHGE